MKRSRSLSGYQRQSFVFTSHKTRIVSVAKCVIANVIINSHVLTEGRYHNSSSPRVLWSRKIRGIEIYLILGLVDAQILVPIILFLFFPPPCPRILWRLFFIHFDNPFMTAWSPGYRNMLFPFWVSFFLLIF